MFKKLFVSLIIVCAFTASPLNAYAELCTAQAVPAAVVTLENDAGAKPELCSVSTRAQSARNVKSAQQQKMPKPVKANPMTKGMRF